MSTHNPFANRKAVVNPVEFYGRNDDVKGILKRAISHEGQSCNVYGEPRIGRTSLLQFILHPSGARANDELWPPGPEESEPLFVLCSLDGLLQGKPTALLRLLLNEMIAAVEAVDESRAQVLRTLSPKSGQAAGDYEISTALNQGIERLNRPVLFLLDDFDTWVDRLDKDDIVDVTRYLRSLTMDAEVNYVIATVDPLNRFFENRDILLDTSPFLNILYFDPLGPLSEEGSHAFVHGPVTALPDTPVRFDESDFSFLIGEAGRHPDLLKVACYWLFEMKIEAPDTSQRLARERLQRDRHVQTVLEALWQRAAGTTGLRETLMAILRGAKPQPGQSLHDLAERGLIRSQDGRWRISSRLFLDYAAARAESDDEHADARGVGHPSRSGAVTVQGRRVELTPLELSLYQSLAEEPGSVRSRDLLIDAVWDDPDAGSNDALDQLVRRLRQKIEPDPRTPRFIVTARGEGYKLLLEPEP